MPAEYAVEQLNSRFGEGRIAYRMSRKFSRVERKLPLIKQSMTTGATVCEFSQVSIVVKKYHQGWLRIGCQ
jgi:hypothetical protein